MENKPVLCFTGWSPTTGSDPEMWRRFFEWQESYGPMTLQMGVKEYYMYRIVKERPEYPVLLLTPHFDNFDASVKTLLTPERKAFAADFTAWIKRRVIDYIWMTTYELITSFKSNHINNLGTEDTRIEKSKIMHVEGYLLTPEDQEKYMNWLNEYGFNVLMPLILNLPGLKEYDFYKNIEAKYLLNGREWQYPNHVSVIYFEDAKAFEDYTHSAEQIAFQKAVHNVFPNGLNLKWYVQYQLMKNWRK